MKFLSPNGKRLFRELLVLANGNTVSVIESLRRCSDTRGMVRLSELRNDLRRHHPKTKKTQ